MFMDWCSLYYIFMTLIHNDQAKNPYKTWSFSPNNGNQVLPLCISLQYGGTWLQTIGTNSSTITLEQSITAAGRHKKVQLFCTNSSQIAWKPYSPHLAQSTPFPAKPIHFVAKLTSNLCFAVKKKNYNNRALLNCSNLTKTYKTIFDYLCSVLYGA